MPKYTVFESTNMRAVHFAERIFDCVCNEPVENGTFGYFEELADGYSNVYKFVKGTKEGVPVVVANNPAWNEDTCRIPNQRRDQYIIPAGTVFRAFALHEGDEFGITIEGVSSATQSIVAEQTDFAANDVFLTVGTDGKLVASGTSTDGAAMEARVERKRMIGATLVTGVREYGYANAMYEARIKVLA